jgi:hypothetical protein
MNMIKATTIETPGENTETIRRDVSVSSGLAHTGYAEVVDSLNRLAVTLAADALRKLGVTSFETSPSPESIGIADNQRRFFDYLVRLLAAEADAARNEDPNKLIHAIKAHSPQGQEELALLCRAAVGIPDVLTGRKHSIEVLAPLAISVP